MIGLTWFALHASSLSSTTRTSFVWMLQAHALLRSSDTPRAMPQPASLICKTDMPRAPSLGGFIPLHLHTSSHHTQLNHHHHNSNHDMLTHVRCGLCQHDVGWSYSLPTILTSSALDRQLVTLGPPRQPVASSARSSSAPHHHGRGVTVREAEERQADQAVGEAAPPPSSAGRGTAGGEGADLICTDLHQVDSSWAHRNARNAAHSARYPQQYTCLLSAVRYSPRLVYFLLEEVRHV